MKIPKYVTLEQEIEVDVSAEDIAAAIVEDPNRVHTCMVGINNFASFAKSIPDPVISEMSGGARKTIGDFLRGLSERFSPTGKSEKSDAAQFIVIGSGESYTTKICSEIELAETVAGMIYDAAKEMPPAERWQWENDLVDDAHWSHAPDIGRIRFSAGLGETDHIDIWRIL